MRRILKCRQVLVMQIFVRACVSVVVCGVASILCIVVSLQGWRCVHLIYVVCVVCVLVVCVMLASLCFCVCVRVGVAPV